MGACWIANLGIADVCVLEPGEAIAQQRLAHREVIEARHPLRFGVEVVEPHLTIGGPRPVVALLLQFDVVGFVLELIPFLFEILFLEVVIADHGQFGGQLEVVRQDQPVAREDASAPRSLLRFQIATTETQVIVAIVVDTPGIEQAGGLVRKSEDRVSLVRERRARCRPAHARGSRC